MRHAFLCLASCGAVLLACNHPTAGGFPPAGLEIVAGDSQVRSAGRPVRVAPTVRVTDADGHPLAGVPVTFAGVRTAVVSPPVVVTDREGLAALEDWTLRTDGGEDTLVATVPGLDPVRFSATSLVVNSVSVGEFTTCVLLTGGRGYCWGANGVGQLGTGDTIEVHRPVPIAGGLRFTAVALERNQVCGLGVDAWVYCAGLITGFGPPVVPTMTEVGAQLRFRQLTVLGGPRCAIAEGGEAYCWGPGTGYLPTDTLRAMNPSRPLRVPVSGTRPLREIAGDLVASAFGNPLELACVLDSQGRVECWDVFGWTLRSPLGTATFDQISVGGPLICGLVRGAVSCWKLPLFTQVPLSLPPIVAIEAAQGLTCGIAGTGGIYCWGEGLSPKVVPGTEQRFYADLAVSLTHACAIDRDNALWCWGENTHGELGDGSTTPSLRPVQVTLDF